MSLLPYHYRKVWSTPPGGRYSIQVKHIVSSITSKGQVTIPAEVRRHLRIEQGDKISFVIEDEGIVRIEAPHYHNVASLRGAAGSLEKPISWEEMIRVAREDRAHEIANSDTGVGARSGSGAGTRTGRLTETHAE